MKSNMEELTNQLLDLIGKKIYVNVVYEHGGWYYILHQLPSIEDIKFSESGECQDGDMWLDSSIINSDWFSGEGYKSYPEALENGIKAAYLILPLL